MAAGSERKVISARPATLRSHLRQVGPEWVACANSFGYWCDHWVQLYDPAPASAGGGAWAPFHLWPSQIAVADVLQQQRLVVMLKARQLGMSWLVAAYGLWLMIFHPAATVLLFSKRDVEAVHLLSFRLRGIYNRLPAHMQAGRVLVDNAHEFRLSNGSAALAFPTTGGRSYTGTLAIVDEADHVSSAAGTGDLQALLDAVKPTIDAGGRLILLSTVDKRAPASAFKRIYEAARTGANSFTPVFLPWSARPDRTEQWYAAVRQDILARSGALDSLYAEYPANDVEALAALTSDARFAAEWLSRADDTRRDGDDASARPDRVRHSVAVETCQVSAAPTLPNLTVYDPPRPGRMYIIGADPAEGNPQSDESAACVIDAVTGDQVALWAGRCEPGTFAAGLQVLADWYREAGSSAEGLSTVDGRNLVGIMVERNNHGHAVLLALREGVDGIGAAGVLNGLDGQRGWLTTARNKVLAVAAAADLLRDGSPKLRDAETLRQLTAFSGSTLAAPPGDHDDRAMAWCLAVAAARHSGIGTGQYAILPPRWSIDQSETGGW